MAEYQYFTILAVVNVLFFLNHFYVRWLRKKTDAKISVEVEALAEHKDQKKKQKKKKEKAKTVKKADKISTKARFQSHLKAFFVGLLHKEKNAEVSFVEWKHINRNLGKISTTILLLLSAMLLSKDFLELVGIGTLGNQGVELCSSADYEKGLRELNTTLDSAAVTNLPQARRQTKLTNSWFNALRTATTLYGTAGFNCQTPASDSSVDCLCKVDEGKFQPYATTMDWIPWPTIPQYEVKDEKWLGTIVDGKRVPGDRQILYGNYFPGVCQLASENAIIRIKSQKCYVTECVCGKIIGICWGGATKHCFRKLTPCPAHQLDAGDEEENLSTLRDAQYAREAAQLEQELTSKLNGYKEQAQAEGEQLLKKILYQIDIAGTCYIAYVAVSMFFPAPLKIFRTGIATQIKQTFFGAHKYTFIAIVLAIWWGTEYFLDIAYDPELQLYYKSLFGNPCYGDADFLQMRQDLINQKCRELIPMRDQQQIESLSIEQIYLEWVDMKKDTCCGKFPAQSIQGSFAGIKQEFTLDESIELGFDRSFFDAADLLNSVSNVGLSLRQNILFQKTGQQDFMGSDRLCMDKDYAQQFLEPPDREVDWVAVWLSSGLLATLFVKVALSNFCVALMYFADPLSKCGGKYEYPPERFVTDDIYEVLVDLKNLKNGALKAQARRSVFIWGFIFNMCVLNLGLSTFGYSA